MASRFRRPATHSLVPAGVCGFREKQRAQHLAINLRSREDLGDGFGRQLRHINDNHHAEIGYTGTIAWSVTSSPALTNGCATISSTTVSDTSAVTAARTVYTSASGCASSAVRGTKGMRTFWSATTTGPDDPYSRFGAVWMIVTLCITSFLLAAFLRHRPRTGYVWVALVLVTALEFGLTGCGSRSSSSSSSSNAVAGTYTLTITGTDTSSSSITATTTMTLTVD